MNSEAFGKACGELGIDLTSAQLTQFEAFEEALYAANQVMNLTRVPQEECWLRHFVDSLLIESLIPQGAIVVDLGTGPGFPAFPLAVARPDLRVIAMDSSGKMLGFLRKQKPANMEVVQIRAEESRIREAADFITGRAVAPLAIQLELSAPMARLGGVIVPMRSAHEEFFDAFLEPLGLKLEEVVQKELPGTEIKRSFPIYRKVQKSLAKYPRKWAEIKARPLG
ncbi:MAG: class I SAM-dependent methyltransferase [Armatimonadetes bacterium]|nr:class I SAM-dependent methyltransferase [Armatimonadota bacterium]